MSDKSVAVEQARKSSLDFTVGKFPFVELAMLLPLSPYQLDEDLVRDPTTRPR